MEVSTLDEVAQGEGEVVGGHNIHMIHVSLLFVLYWYCSAAKHLLLSLLHQLGSVIATVLRLNPAALCHVTVPFLLDLPEYSVLACCYLFYPLQFLDSVHHNILEDKFKPQRCMYKVHQDALHITTTTDNHIFN